jgi:hypothetical protein
VTSAQGSAEAAEVAPNPTRPTLPTSAGLLCPDTPLRRRGIGADVGRSRLVRAEQLKTTKLGTKPRTKVYPRSTPMAARSRPRPGWCLQCRAPIWGCTYDALPLKLDPYALTPKGELIAHLFGLRTWLVSAGSLVVWRRHVWAIRTSPTGIGGFIVRDHRCGMPVLSKDQIRDLKRYNSEDPGF